MKNKKAWIRVVEAVIAIIIVLGAFLVIMSRNRVPSQSFSSEEIYEKQNQILEMITKNETLREKIIKNDTKEINDYISKVIPGNWNFTISICEITKVCGANLPNDKEVYSAETIVTSTLREYKPKKFRFFVWVK